jgi:hypothetical protein
MRKSRETFAGFLRFGGDFRVPDQTADYGYRSASRQAGKLIGQGGRSRNKGRLIFLCVCIKVCLKCRNAKQNETKQDLESLAFSRCVLVVLLTAPVWGQADAGGVITLVAKANANKEQLLL